MPPLPGRANQAFSKGKQVSESEMSDRAEALSPRRTWKSKEEDIGVWSSAQGEAEAEEVL